MRRMRRSNHPAARRAGDALRGNGGFTMVELLVTVVLVAIIGSIITLSVTLALRQFRARTQDSDAQLLCSALALFVQDELTYAGNIVTTEVTDEGGATRNEVKSFTDHARDLGAECSFKVTNGQLRLQFTKNKIVVGEGEGAALLNYYDPIGKGAYGLDKDGNPTSNNKSLSAGIKTNADFKEIKDKDGNVIDKYIKNITVTITVYENEKPADPGEGGDPAAPAVTSGTELASQTFTVKPIAPGTVS